MKRAEFLQKSIVLAGASVVLPSFASPVADSFSLPALPYAFDALEPHIDRLTMEIHHDRHHKAYVDNLNKALPGTTKSIEEILASVSSQPVAVRNNGGGHWNHSFFWNVLAPAKGSKPSATLAKQIDTDFGSFDAFKTEFAKAATSRFGSGWAWLIKKDGKLVISSTPNQDNPLMDLAEVKGQPILALDVWEHAYYLKYMNKRADYIAAFWNLVNWDFVSTNFDK
ncbi:MAG: superoxide dismutase [Cytophagales bacterium]|nr:superoxide dismutase [Cytophagales bacterium]